MTANEQRDYVRELARQVMAIACEPEMESKRQRWRDAYMLRKPDRVPVTFGDLWVWTESQAFGQVSPDMWREFLLDYQMPILTRYGCVSYGCCEDLTTKIDDVLSIPNLRIFVNSPWTDLRAAADKCRGRACIAWRQKATDVIFADDLAAVRRHTEEGLRATQDCCRVIVLQEVMTTNGRPKRLAEWTAMARDASERLS